MDKVYVKLTVYFEDPFWVGVFERIENGRLTVCAVEIKEQKAVKNPKRLQREVKKQVANIGIGTKSQQALKLLHEQNKTEQQAKSREQIREEKKRKFDLKQQKRRKNHKGH